MITKDLASAIEQSHAALAAILKGDPSAYKALYSGAEDVTLGNPFGPYARGRKHVEATLEGAASHYRDGEVTGAELIASYVSGDLACVVEVERGRAKVGGGEELVGVAVRVTSVFRLEQGAWKLVHRHADPITTQRPAESVINNQPGGHAVITVHGTHVTKDWAQHFAKDWVDSWNAHDLDRVLSHYADDVEMSSPFIAAFSGEPSGTLKGKVDVGAYWRTALQRIPDLRFELIEVFVCVNSITIYYKAVLGKLAIEVFFFNADGKAFKALAHYDTWCP